MPPRYNQVNINELAKLYDVERQNLIGRHGKSVAKAGTKYVSNLMDSLKKKATQDVSGLFGKGQGWLKTAIPFVMNMPVPGSGAIADPFISATDASMKNQAYKKLLASISPENLPASLKNTYLGPQITADTMSILGQAQGAVRGRQGLSNIMGGIETLGAVPSAAGAVGDWTGLDLMKTPAGVPTPLGKGINKVQNWADLYLEKLTGIKNPWKQFTSPLFEGSNIPGIESLTPRDIMPTVSPMIEEYFSKPYQSTMAAYAPPPSRPRRR